MDINSLRVQKLREYLFDVIKAINENIKQINVDMLDNDINNYSLDKVPTESVVEKWITGNEIHRDVYSFRSRNSYSQDTITNLENIGFFETLESIINSNNKEGILPDIKGIEDIKCLNCGTMLSGETKTAIFNIEIQITYKI
jgi:hypothetical protein